MAGDDEEEPLIEESSSALLGHRMGRGGAILSSSPHTLALLRRSQANLHSQTSLTSVNEHKADQAPDQDFTANTYEDFTTIDWIHDMAKDRLRREAVRARVSNFRGWVGDLWDASSAWFLLALVGVVTGLCAGYVDMGVQWVEDVKEGYCLRSFWVGRDLCCPNGLLGCVEWKPWSDLYGVAYLAYVGLAALFAAVSAWLVWAFAPYASGSGIPEVKTVLAGFVIRGYLGVWTLIVKMWGLILSVGSGLSLGKEGPYVHLACCVCNVCVRLSNKFKRNEVKRREMFSSACAAGVAVAFGAPIGGVLFSLEEASYYFPHKTLWRSFFCAVVAALTLQVSNPHHNGRIVLFDVIHEHNWHYFELLPFALLGVMGGALGALFIRLNIVWCRVRKNRWGKSIWSVVEVIAVALITATLSYINPYLRHGMSGMLGRLFNDCNPDALDSSLTCHLEDSPGNVALMIVGGLTRLLLTVFTFGLKVPAGLFIPSMQVGALLGRSMGVGVHVIAKAYPDAMLFNECVLTTSCVCAPTYALMGAAAMLGGVTRMTISLVVIVFELTGRLEFIMPLMITILISKWVGDAFAPGGIYDEHIELNNYPFLDTKIETNVHTPVSQVMRSEGVCVIYADNNTLGSLEALLKDEAYSGFPVVSSPHDGLVEGYIARGDLAEAIAQVKRHNRNAGPSLRCDFSGSVGWTSDMVDLRPWMDIGPLQVPPTTPLNVIVEIFTKLGVRKVLVSKQGRLLGVVTKKDVVNFIAVEEHSRAPTPHPSKRQWWATKLIGRRRRVTRVPWEDTSISF